MNTIVNHTPQWYRFWTDGRVVEVDMSAQVLACRACGRELEWVIAGSGRALLETGTGAAHACKPAKK